MELKRDLIGGGGCCGGCCCPLVKSGRLRVKELDREEEMDRMFSAGSEGLCLMFPTL